MNNQCREVEGIAGRTASQLMMQRTRQQRTRREKESLDEATMVSDSVVLFGWLASIASVLRGGGVIVCVFSSLVKGSFPIYRSIKTTG